MMKPLKINTFHANTSDIDKEEVGEYFAYDGLPSKVGDLVILEIYPEFDDIMKQVKYIQEDKYPPEYLVLARVTRFNEQDIAQEFFCKILSKSPGDKDQC